MKCPKCGADLEKDQQFCTQCGTPVPRKNHATIILLSMIAVLLIALCIVVGINVIPAAISRFGHANDTAVMEAESSAVIVSPPLEEASSEQISEPQDASPAGDKAESSAEDSSAAEPSETVTRNGWVEEDGGWRYYDKTGKYLTAQWVHDGDDNYYVDENGFMLTETWMDTEIGQRYLGADGKMIVEGWVYPDLAAAYPNQPYYGSPYIRNTVLLTDDWLVMNPTESFAGAECVYFGSDGDFDAVANMDYIEEMLNNYYRSYLVSINEQDISCLEYTSDINRAKMATRISNSSNKKNIYTSYGIWIDWDSVLLADNAKVYLNAFVEFSIVNRSDGKNEHTSSNYYSFELTTDNYEDDYIVNRIAYPTEDEYACHTVAAFE